MTPKRRVPLGKRVRRAEMEERLEHEARTAAKRGRARERAAYNERLSAGLDQRALADAMARVLADQDAAVEAAAARPRPRGAATRAMPAAARGRWVPIGPSVVRRGQALDRPRVSGRIRDIHVDGTGTRAYAGSAMGGVWYTDDGGSTWAPVGGWAERSRVVGGTVNAQAIGCLLVSFRGTAAQDVVLAGTGEYAIPGIPASARATGEAIGGVGVLAATGPVGLAAPDPWEPDTGLAQLEGLATFRLVRNPLSVAGKSGAPAVADRDVVVACTSNGAFVGTRQPLPAAPPLLARDGYVWAPMTALNNAYPGAAVSDAVWLPGGRLVLAVVGTGLVFTDDAGATAPTSIAGAAPVGVMSLANFANRLYLLGETGGAPTLWTVPDATVAAPACAVVPGLPATLWGRQRDYDQAIAVDVAGGNNRVYVGGSAAQPRPSTDYGASLYAYDHVGANLQPAANVSRTGAPAGGDGADQAGLIGNNVHGDVHAIRLTGAAPPRRQVWVATDGGVFVSDRSGRVQTFAAMNTGIAALQPVFVRNHPVSGHLVGVGTQDNGTQVRTGDTVWDEVFEADGGGLAFHPVATHRLVRQYTTANWYCQPGPGFVDPMTRRVGSVNFGSVGTEDGASAFYSGVATVLVPHQPNPSTGRLALGTDRVWVTDDLTTGLAANTWQTLPYPNGPVQDGRAGPPAGTPSVAQLAFGRPTPALGSVITLAWASTTELLVVYVGGIVRYTETSAGNWVTKTWRLNDSAVAIPRTTIPTDVCPVPSSRNFYVATIGVVGGADETLWFYSPSDDQFHRTGLRHVLDPPPPPPNVTGPRDPAYAVTLDPADPTVVFVGTATGVWRGHRTNVTGGHDWAAFVNGLPQAAVQDLHTWVDPAGGAEPLRLLRAGVSSRSVWEVDLSADAKRRTWIRANDQDNRRLPLAPTRNELVSPATPAPFTSSPDIVVRPRWPFGKVPEWLSGAKMDSVLNNPYQLWTFQTAFRWLYPSVAATGQWTEALGNLVALHRTSIGKTAAQEIDAAVWSNVVGTLVGSVVTGGVRVKVDGTVTTSAADPLAVYRAPWHTTRAPAVPPTEVDLRELVVPFRQPGGLWEVFGEPSTVDVLLHHRDGRAVPAGGAYAVLLWRSGANAAALMALTDGAALATYLTSVTTGPPGAVPAGWNVATSGGNVRWPLSAPLEGRSPRGVSIDVDLTGTGPSVVLLAFVYSSADDTPMVQPSTSTVANVAPTDVTQLVTCWPYAAARVVQISARPV